MEPLDRDWTFSALAVVFVVCLGVIVAGPGSCSSKECKNTAAARDLACGVDPAGLACKSLTDSWNTNCAPTPTTTTTTTTTTTLPPEPPPVACTLPDTSRYTLVQNAQPQRESEVAAAVAALCKSDPTRFVDDCTRLAGWDGGAAADRFFAAVAAELQKDYGICAGQPVEGTRRIDKLAVVLSDGRHEAYHLVNYAKGELLTAHNAWLRGGTWAAPVDDGCGEPAPPRAYRINIKYPHNANCANTDTTIVVKDADYCRKIGSDQLICPVRLEGASDRAACEARLRGPYQTWKCDGCEVFPCATGGCACAGKVNTNPAQAVVLGHGKMTTCIADGTACGTLDVP